MVYAVVRAGGRQEKVEVGTIVVLDRVQAENGSTIQLSPVLLVGGLLTLGGVIWTSRPAPRPQPAVVLASPTGEDTAACPAD